MTWLLVVGSLWLLLAFGAAVVIGRGIRLAESTDSDAMTAEIDRFLLDSGDRLTAAPHRRPLSG